MLKFPFEVFFNAKVQCLRRKARELDLKTIDLVKNSALRSD